MKRRSPRWPDPREAYAADPVLVYAYVSPSDVVVYIGRTVDPTTRHGAHRQRSPWWTPDLAFAVIYECLGWECGKRCERMAIRDHEPIANIMHNGQVRKFGAAA